MSPDPFEFSQETPLKREGLPEDIALAARFLCSEGASFITGQVVNVYGGAVRPMSGMDCCRMIEYSLP